MNFVIQDYGNQPKQIRDEFCQVIWHASKYLSGSISSEIPYEVEYSLNAALKDWINRNAVITTALLNDREFHFSPLDPWKTIKLLIPAFDFAKIKFDALLIQIALPRLYKHRPLYNVALYHELGHFVDQTIGVTKGSFLLAPPTYNLAIEMRHRAEYFADLFAANYAGHANCKLLNDIAGGATVTSTHPATVDRISVVEDFLAGRSNALVDLFQDTLAMLSAPPLQIRYVKPNINNAFDNIRPYAIADEGELHGIMEAAWDFLDEVQKNGTAPWSHFDDQEIGRIVNDLTEKSIRNKAILEKWKHGTFK